MAAGKQQTKNYPILICIINCRMRILSLSAAVFLQPHLGSGKTRLRWTSGLKELGHQVDILQPSDVEIWAGFKKARRWRLAIGTFLKARKLINRNRYDLIEFYGDDYWLFLWWLKKFNKNTPLLVAHVDGLELYDREKERRFWGNPAGNSKWWQRFNEKLSALRVRSRDTVRRRSSRSAPGSSDARRAVPSPLCVQSNHERFGDQYHQRGRERQ